MHWANIDVPLSIEFWAKVVASHMQLDLGAIDLDSSESSGEFIVAKNGHTARIQPPDLTTRHQLEGLLGRRGASIAFIDMIGAKDSVHVVAHFFSGALLEIGDVEVGVDEQLIRPSIKAGIRFRNIKDLAVVLTDQFSLSLGDSDRDKYFLLAAGPEIDTDFLPSDADEWSLRGESALNDKCFCLIGEGIRIPIVKRQMGSENEIFFAHRLIRNAGRGRALSVRLARGRIRFTDYTRTGRMAALAAGAMRKLVQRKDSYLNKWDAYGEIEGEIFLKRIRNIGGRQIEMTEQTPEGTRLLFAEMDGDNQRTPLSEGSDVEITQDLPSYIEDENVTWKQFTDLIEQETASRLSRYYSFAETEVGGVREDGSEVAETAAAGELRRDSFRVLRTERSGIVVDQPVPVEMQGAWVVPSVIGDTAQIERRMRARQRILDGRSANPLLGLIIEENAELPPPFRRPSLRPLTHFVKKKIFKSEPTETQTKAIDIALNTPDIVVIQGPPGTGKTTVISAIIERLNEEHDKSNGVKGEILVTGFQHDAVENIISRLSVNALPPVKFGRRSGQDHDLVGERIGIWCNDLAARVREKNPSVKQSEDQRRLSELTRRYRNSPSLRHAISLLRQIEALPPTSIDNELKGRTRDLLETLQTESEGEGLEDADKLRSVRRLRYTRDGFEDDGPESAALLKEYCWEDLQDDERMVLRRAILWEGEDVPDLFVQLKNIKMRLLTQLSPRPVFQVEKPRNDVLRHVAEVVHQVDIATRQSGGDPTLAILADFLFELECNPNGVIEAVEDYNFVYAATCQAAYGSAIRKAKQRGSGKRDQEIVFDTVIVDEAARVSPRDLLIPMAQGQRRIILVGDHRQLPHLVDDSIADELQEKIGSHESDFIRQSMFEYLMGRLKQLERADGIQRTITLDAQYRMHPELGAFVSDQFYAPYGESFVSPLPSTQFDHNLPGVGNTPFAWLDVASDEGGCVRTKAGSWYREAEAQRIAQQLSRWIETDEGKALSFGIITFYKAQTKSIYEALEKYNFTKQGPDGAWEVIEEFRFLRSDKHNERPTERLRIGTVDAFQGMEFDVVFLSVTRSLRPSKGKNSPAKVGNEGKSLFGRLLSENLQCVSMSRQKRLLVVTGDSALMRHPIANTSIPALCAYREICESRGVVL